MSQRVIGINGYDTDHVAQQIETEMQPFEDVRFISVIVNNQADRSATVQALVIFETNPEIIGMFHTMK